MFDIFLTQYNGTFLGPIAWVLGKVLNGIYAFLSNFGIENAALSIILFTFIINGLMIPLTVKQQKWSKLSSKMAPEINKITAKYKGKKDEASLRAQQLETQAVYDKYGTSPTGGCLPMFITMFIFLALYRVIYAIPAYVGPIKDLYQQIADVTNGNTNALNFLVENAKNLGVSTKGWGTDLVGALQANGNYIIDILSKFGKANWADFANLFQGADAATVAGVSDKIMHVNGFLGGLNITESPITKLFPGIIIPILSVATQFIQTKLTMSGNPIDKDNPTAASMNTMNHVMPFVSGAMCLFFPIGVGIYWVTGNVFRIIQQIFVNRYMENADLDAMIEKNAEKVKKKREKMGVESYDGNLRNIAQTRTSSIREKANAKNAKEEKGDPSNYQKGQLNYEKGSISSIANMLANSSEKTKGE